MDQYVSNICPFCKATFTEADEVIFCDNCGTQHHTACWIENRGCSTYGCRNQSSIVGGKRCEKCAAVLVDGYAFCSECGTPVATSQPAALQCTACLSPIAPGQQFCAGCGQRIGVTLDATVANKINQANANLVKLKRNKILIPIIAIGAVLALVFGIIKFMPDVEKLVSVGDYEKAYQVVSSSGKDDIMKENAVAFVSAISASSLKDRSSFELRDAYVNEDYSGIVLNVAGKNSYGGIVTNYWYYTFNKEDKTFSLMTTYTTLEEVKEYSFDDASERLEKVLKNLFLAAVKKIIRDGSELSRESVKNINHLFAEDIIFDVELISAVKEVERSE